MIKEFNEVNKDWTFFDWDEWSNVQRKIGEDKYFPYYVCKWVRPNHVQTNEHWTRNWKKAELMKIKYYEEV